MNVQLKDITVTARDGRVSHLEQVYIRGSHVRFFIVPDMLRYGHLSPIAIYDPTHGSPWTPKLTSFFPVGTPPCSAPATSAAAVSVSPAVVRQSAGRARVVVAVPGKTRPRPRNILKLQPQCNVGAATIIGV